MEEVFANMVMKYKPTWLTNKTTEELDDCSIDNIFLHVKIIFSDGKLIKKEKI